MTSQWTANKTSNMPDYLLSSYDYDLPQMLIAQTPAPNRDQSRLLKLCRDTGKTQHLVFSKIADLIRPSDLMVVNDVRVAPARLFGKKSTGGKVEALIIDYGPAAAAKAGDKFVCECLVKASKKPKAGTEIEFDHRLKAKVIEPRNQICVLEFECSEDPGAVLEEIGIIPLPPYIRRERDEAPPCDDKNRYQTVYAKNKGAVAAPTAGLHFTPHLLQALEKKGVETASITLNVGYGTFMPVRHEDVRNHKMHTESFEISESAAKKINDAKKEGRRIVAVGTTTVRTLEFAASDDGMVRPGAGMCDLFISPGYRFKAIDALITNFHLPRSTLLMLVSALCSRKMILNAYKEAVEKKYRFFSYGDAMFIE